MPKSKKVKKQQQKTRQKKARRGKRKPRVQGTRVMARHSPYSMVHPHKHLKALMNSDLGAAVGARFMHTALDPFNPSLFGNQQGYFPGNTRHSFKCSARAKTVIPMIAGGNAWVLVTPTMAKDITFFSVQYETTTGSISGQNLQLALQANTTLTSISMSGFPFTAAACSAGEYSARCSGVGIKVRYVGNQLNKGGQVKAWLDHSGYGIDIVAASNVFSVISTAMDSDPSTRVISLTEVAEAEFNYSPATISYGSGTGVSFGRGDWTNGNSNNTAQYTLDLYHSINQATLFNAGARYVPQGILMIQAPSAGGIQVEIDFVAHIEIHAPTLVALSTPSPGNALAADHVAHSVNHALQTHAQDPKTKPLEHGTNVMGALASAATTFVSQTAKLAMPGATSVASDAIVAGLSALLL